MVVRNPSAADVIDNTPRVEDVPAGGALDAARALHGIQGEADRALRAHAEAAAKNSPQLKLGQMVRFTEQLGNAQRDTVAIVINEQPNAYGDDIAWHLVVFSGTGTYTAWSRFGPGKPGYFALMEEESIQQTLPGVA